MTIPISASFARVNSEAERLSPGLQKRLAQAIDYLETLTREYSSQEETLGGADGSASGNVNGAAEKGEAYPLDLIARAVDNMFAGEAREAGIDLRVQGGDCMTRVPALALIRSTSNLIASALRHAAASAITLDIEEVGGRCQIIVSDNGRGMDTDTLERVQRSGAKLAASDGDGLGLAIVHELAARHDFGFSLQSQPGQGISAILDLPD